MRRRSLLLVAAAVLATAAATATPARAATASWCGSGEPTADLPDAVDAFSIHVVYALPAGSPDRFAEVAADAVADVQAVSDWWQGQDPARRPRFDLVAASGCPTDAGRIDLSLLRLPGAAGTASYDAIVAALGSAGFDSPDKGYLLYVDDVASVDSDEVCGLGGLADDTLGDALVFLGSCSLASDTVSRQIVVAHELTHAMGAVDQAAPHYCSSGHVCDDATDLMAPIFTQGDTLGSRILDVGHDDYYDHPGGWWDVRDSMMLSWLDRTVPAPPAVAGLTATSSGGGVTVEWTAATAASSSVWYRIYGDDGRLVGEPQSATSYVTAGATGETLQWTVRSENEVGVFSPPVTIRFKVGFGIVDADGALVQDTVAPAAVTGLRAKRSGTNVVVSWRAVADPIGLRGYRVAVGGGAAKTVTGTSRSFPAAKVLGRTVTVTTVDEAGNRSAGVSVTVRR